MTFVRYGMEHHLAKKRSFCQETTQYSIVCWAISVHRTSKLHIAQGTINQLNYVEMLEGRLFRQVSGFLTKTLFFSQMVLHVIPDKCQ